jgi:hypothetical protein
MTPSALGAEAQDAPLCTFAKKVLAERPAEFAKFKGDPHRYGVKGITFVGTITPDEGTECSLHIRRKSGANVLAPAYFCTKSNLKMSDYTRYVGELRSCFSGAVVSESPPEEKDSMLSTSWTAQTADYSVKLHATNGYYVAQSVRDGKPITEETKSTLAVTIEIEDLSPARPGATIPEMP